MRMEVEMIHMAVVEDEALYRNQLKEYLEQYQNENKIQLKVTFLKDGEDITEDYKAEYDIILMDIQMLFMDGMTAAEIIRKKDQEVIIIFITNMTQYAVKGYEVDALYYILKPVSYFALSQKLNRAVQKLQKKHTNYISIPVQDGILKLDMSDIYYVESQRHNLIYHTTGGNHTSRGKMQDVEEALADYGFFRSGKGYLVNMAHVKGMKEGCCMIGGDMLLVSRARKHAFMESLSRYMGEVIG